MKIDSEQKGFSAIEILAFAIILAIIAAIAVPKLLESKQKADEDKLYQARSKADEASAVLTLRVISLANSTYQLTSNGKYATLTELTGAKLLDAGFAANGFKKSGYIFSESITTSADGFCASAIPSGSGADRTFGVDQRNTIYASSENGKNSPICMNGILNSNGANLLE